MKKCALLALIILVLACGVGLAQTSAFTYQGRLASSGAPATGPYQFEFKLFNLAGTQIGTTQTGVVVNVQNGAFSTQLNFGASAFPSGEDRWLEISVRRPGSADPDPYTVLSPRQQINSVPFAVRSLNASTADTATNSTQLGGVAANQYVGTNDSRMTDARIPKPGSDNYIQNTTVGSQPTAFFNIGGSGRIGGLMRIDGNGIFLPGTPVLSLGTNGIFQIDAPAVPSGRFVVLENGNVGIGNPFPSEKLDVVGNGKFSGTISGNGSGLTNVPGTFRWNVVTANQQAESNNGYVINSTGEVVINLPTSMQVGDIIRVTDIETESDQSGWRITANSGQTIIRPQSTTAWTPHESNRDWHSVASSADGTRLVAGVLNGQIYTSTNSGLTWTPRESNRAWTSVASSADGTKLIASAFAGLIYTSTDSGVTWTPHLNNAYWMGVASSADGTKLVALLGGGQIYTSTDSGGTWTPRENNRNWKEVASSADGGKLIAIVSFGQIFTSTDSGVTWTSRESVREWYSVASSTDGTKLVAVVDNGQIYTSTDSGVTWVPRESNRFWYSVASSADGSKLMAGVYFGQIYTSGDSGITWAPEESNRQWRAVALSADGVKLIGVVFQGKIYKKNRSVVAGAMTGGIGSSVELIYLGADKFAILNSQGSIVFF